MEKDIFNLIWDLIKVGETSKNIDTFKRIKKEIFDWCSNENNDLTITDIFAETILSSFYYEIMGMRKNMQNKRFYYYTIDVFGELVKLFAERGYDFNTTNINKDTLLSILISDKDCPWTAIQPSDIFPILLSKTNLFKVNDLGQSIVWLASESENQYVIFRTCNHFDIKFDSVTDAKLKLRSLHCKVMNKALESWGISTSNEIKEVFTKA